MAWLLLIPVVYWLYRLAVYLKGYITELSIEIYFERLWSLRAQWGMELYAYEVDYVGTQWPHDVTVRTTRDWADGCLYLWNRQSVPTDSGSKIVDMMLFVYVDVETDELPTEINQANSLMIVHNGDRWAVDTNLPNDDAVLESLRSFFEMINPPRLTA